MPKQMPKNITSKKTITKKTINTGIQPLGDRVLIEEIESVGEESRTASGIIIPEIANDDKETKRGRVVAVGPGDIVDGELRVPAVKPGDVVIYSWGDKISVAGKKYVLVGAGNISAIISQ